MIQGLILADDITGALDTGVRFAGKGKKLRMIDCHAKGLRDGNEEILVIDTESRHLTGKEAGERIYQQMERADGRRIPLLYKKTDSILRGNIGAELEAMLLASERNIMIFAPAFPQAGRIVKQGRIFADGKPLTETSYSRDRFTPVYKDRVKELIGEQSKLPVVEVSALDKVCVQRGYPVIYVCDACTEEDLRYLAKASIPLLHQAVLAGCAGFASHLSECLGERREDVEVQFRNMRGKHILLCGSISEKTREQIQYAVARGGPSLKLRPEDYICKSISQETIARIYNAQKEADRLLLYTAYGKEDIEKTQEYAQQKGISVSQIHKVIAERLGEIANICMQAPEVEMVSVVGGDTLYHTMKAAGCQNIQPIREWKEGIIMSKVYLGDGGEKIFLSKAGSLGTRTAIWDMLQYR